MDSDNSRSRSLAPAWERARFSHRPVAIRTNAPSQSGRGLFPLPTNRKPSTETGAAHIICHPELAKDLTVGQPTLCHHSAVSKLTAPPDEPSVPIARRLNLTSGSPREIPSTDSGQALRKLPMNLPVGDRRSAPTARPHTSLGQRPRSLSHNGIALKARSISPAVWNARSVPTARPQCSLRHPDLF